MNLKMKTLAAAIIATATVSTANANSLLFPYFNTANGAQSIVTIAANPGTDALGAGGSGTTINNQEWKLENLHYVYNFGPTCDHHDGFGSISQGDLVQHSVADPAFGGIGKVTPTDKSAPVYLPFGQATGTEGFMVVTNNTDSTGAAPVSRTQGVTSTSADLVGSMVVFDPASGLAISYKAISNTSSVEGDFSNITDTNFTLSWYPQNFVDTNWYAVVTSSNMIQTPRYTASTTWNNNNGVRNNDEIYRSGGTAGLMSCSGVIPRDTFNATVDLINASPIFGFLFPGVTSLGLNANVNIPGVRTLGQAADPVLKNGGVARLSFVPNQANSGIVLSKLETVRPAVGAPYSGKTLLTIENNLATGRN